MSAYKSQTKKLHLFEHRDTRSIVCIKIFLVLVAKVHIDSLSFRTVINFHHPMIHYYLNNTEVVIHAFCAEIDQNVVNI